MLREVVERSDLMVPGAGVPIEAMVLTAGEPHAAVVLLHGWGGSAETLIAQATRWAELGYLALSVSLRGWGRSDGRDDCGRQQPEDTADVIRWIGAAHPRGAGRVGLFGISQGGQVALLCAARSSLVSAVAAWAPVTDVARWRETTQDSGHPDYIDDVCADGDLAARSPSAFAAEIRVPVLLVHGDEDTRVPTAQSVLLHRSITRSGGRSRLELLPRVGHHRGPDGNDHAFALTAGFFAVHLAPVAPGDVASPRGQRYG